MGPQPHAHDPRRAEWDVTRDNLVVHKVLTDPNLGISEETRTKLLASYRELEYEFFAQMTMMVLFVKTGHVDDRISDEERLKFMNSPYGRYIDKLFSCLESNQT